MLRGLVVQVDPPHSVEQVGDRKMLMGIPQLLIAVLGVEVALGIMELEEAAQVNSLNSTLPLPLLLINISSALVDRVPEQGQTELS
jgi:hypothetical protein